MATIAHLSDLHFGRHDPTVVGALEAFLIERRPDLVAISGDLTQRARVAQFRMARAFIDRLKQGGLAVLAVPGNHDVPLYDVVRRFLRPLHRYRRYIGEELCPYWENAELAVLGINTARSFTFKHGSVSREQMRDIRARFSATSRKLHLIVTHHPLLAMPLGEGGEPIRIAKRSGDALRAAAEAGIDLLLAGHFHRSFSASTPDSARPAVPDVELDAIEHVEKVGSMLVVQAGTATSTRLRGEEKQSFNWIEANADGIELTVLAWDGTAFRQGPLARFGHDGKGWNGAPMAAPSGH